MTSNIALSIKLVTIYKCQMSSLREFSISVLLLSSLWLPLVSILSMKANKQTGEEVFDRLHSLPRFLPKYPSEEVVKWRFRRLTPPMKILILGCGGGRHVLFLAREGFECTGIDFSQNALDETLMRLNLEELEATVFKLDHRQNLQVFTDNSFDAVLAFSVLYYQNEAQFRATVLEVARILKPAGKFFFNLRTKNDWRFPLCDRDGKLKSFDDDGNPLVEAGLNHLFLNKNEVLAILNRYFDVLCGGYSAEFNGKLNDNNIFDAIRL